MSTKIRLFNKNFSESFQKKFNKIELQYDNENHEFIEVCAEKQIGYVYLLLQPYVIKNEILQGQPELGYLNDFVLSETYGHFTDDKDSETKAIFPHLRLKFRDINESTTFYQTEISTSGNNVNLAGLNSPRMERSNNIFGATGGITGWTNKGNFYGVDNSEITGGRKTYYPLTFANESYYYSGVGGTYQASIDNSEHFSIINDVLTDYSYVCPTNSQLGKIWEKPVGTTTEDYGNRGIYCFGVQGGRVNGFAAYGITTENISDKPSGQDVNSVITAEKPYTRAHERIFRNTPARMLGVTSISGKYIDDARYIFGSMDLALTGDSSDLKGNMPLVVTGGAGESNPAGIVYKNCGYSAPGIRYDNSDTFKETDLNKMGLGNVDTETSGFSVNGKHFFLMAIPFELQAETSNNVTTYKPVLTETIYGGEKRVVDLTQPIELDLIWSRPINANEDGSYTDDAKSFIEENMSSANYNYLNDFDDTNRYQIQDTTDYAALVTDLKVKHLTSGRYALYDGDTENSELATGIIPFAMKTVFLVQDDCFNGAPLNYEQNIDYIFVPDSDIKTNNNFRKFTCNPYSPDSGNIYVSMYPDFRIGIDTDGSSVQG